jgi:aldose 1-epimerase
MSSVEKKLFDHYKGSPVDLYTLDNGRVRVELLTYGAIVRSILVPDSKGGREDIVMGFDNMEGYKKDVAYLGVVVGRVANRIGREIRRFGYKTSYKWHTVLCLF